TRVPAELSKPAVALLPTSWCESSPSIRHRGSARGIAASHLREAPRPLAPRTAKGAKSIVESAGRTTEPGIPAGNCDFSLSPRRRSGRRGGEGGQPCQHWSKTV